MVKKKLIRKKSAKKSTRKPKSKYIVGLIPPDHYGGSSSPKTAYRKSRTKTLAEARRKGEKLFDKRRKSDIEGSDVVIFKKGKSGKYKEHSFFTGEWEK